MNDPFSLLVMTATLLALAVGILTWITLSYDMDID